ncbi:hypothetical protein CKAH01_06203 [Colletotrichum kahawae]|uniref:SNF2 N-terminal domain-containing protein n=1 Tax=Colletotrichum kahawae TaxID=34407 RepID=A0AAD9YAZ5_COLKA|nr:hypothetical protein CKAH01_06203 [Colletotrichum kahawae]
MLSLRQIPLQLEDNCRLICREDPQFHGTLGPCDAELLDSFRSEGIIYELFGVPVGRHQTEQGDIPIWATVYGPRNLAQNFGQILSEADYYFQDPVLSLTDAEYFNPQRFFNTPDARTTDFSVSCLGNSQLTTEMDETHFATDVLKGLVSENDLLGTNGSPFLLTELKSHQKQGLTFMLGRERGWRLHENGRDVWSWSLDEMERPRYTNNINSMSQTLLPPQFQGGILADLMGLGKTLSMISLIAHDKILGDKNGSSIIAADGTTCRGTLIVLPPSLLHNWEKELSR